MHSGVSRRTNQSKKERESPSTFQLCSLAIQVKKNLSRVRRRTGKTGIEGAMPTGRAGTGKAFFQFSTCICTARILLAVPAAKFSLQCCQACITTLQSNNRMLPCNPTIESPPALIQWIRSTSSFLMLSCRTAPVRCGLGRANSERWGHFLQNAVLPTSQTSGSLFVHTWKIGFVKTYCCEQMVADLGDGP